MISVKGLLSVNFKTVIETLENICLKEGAGLRIENAGLFKNLGAHYRKKL